MSTWLFQVLVNAGAPGDGGQKALEYSEQSDTGEEDELKAKILKQKLKELRKICCPHGELSTGSQPEMKTVYELCAVIVNIDST